MRVILNLSKNKRPVPFNYQQQLVGVFHRWLGINDYHDDLSLYSLSWLQHIGHVRKKTTPEGLHFPYGATFFISSPLQDLQTRAVQGIFQDEEVAWGMKVDTVTLVKTKDYGSKHTFVAQSPILVKRSRGIGEHQHYYYPSDPESTQFLTETLQTKLQRMNLPTDVQVAFDKTYAQPIIKKIRYRDIDIKATLCPVVVEGDPRAVAAAWEVGVGNSTGIGFGALR